MDQQQGNSVYNLFVFDIFKIFNLVSLTTYNIVIHNLCLGFRPVFPGFRAVCPGPLGVRPRMPTPSGQVVPPVVLPVSGPPGFRPVSGPPGFRPVSGPPGFRPVFRQPVVRPDLRPPVVRPVFRPPIVRPTSSGTCH